MSIDNSTSSADAVLERTNAREIDETVIRSSPDLVVCDASFIPLHKVCLCVYTRCVCVYLVVCDASFIPLHKVCLCVYMYIYLYLYLCVCVCVYLSVLLSIRLSIYLST